MISDCVATATSDFTVNDNGLLAVYAVCPVHLAAIRNGTMFAAPADPTRGFIGLRDDNDTRGPL
ncbi:hypothetical protein B7R21_17905 [Subtercola boreus]|uniref:Uncharacterized protein n=1 Tax=Subtercola boreus TaxID=120213 RepID=A0A3E0VAY2_9MICO|nr:hypothetical protein B7R21_17905 [Subtercola boreus]